MREYIEIGVAMQIVLALAMLQTAYAGMPSLYVHAPQSCPMMRDSAGKTGEPFPVRFWDLRQLDVLGGVPMLEDEPTLIGCLSPPETFYMVCEGNGSVTEFVVPLSVATSWGLEHEPVAAPKKKKRVANANAMATVTAQAIRERFEAAGKSCDMFKPNTAPGLIPL